MPETINFDTQPAELILFPGCDPYHRLSSAFIEDDIANKPELVILNWLVALPTAIDPAFAAQSVLIKLNRYQTKLSSDQKSVVALLSEITCHPREKILDEASVNKRRQRRRI